MSKFSVSVKSAGVLSVGLLLAACTEPSDYFDEVNPSNPNDTCGAASMQSMVGQDGSLAEATNVPNGKRILRPGDIPLLNDDDPSRVTFAIGSDGLISYVRCG